MPACSSPVQCQMAKRAECTCDCNGANHGVLRKMIEDPNTKEEAEEKLKDLKVHQAELKKTKRVERRKKRAEARKAQKES